MIKVITYQECMKLWSKLWESRVSPIEPMSSMRLPCRTELAERPNIRFYTKDIADPVFLGIYEGKQLIGVNSFHRVDGTTRSRGLYVLPEYRGQGLATKLLRDTWNRCTVLPLWSFPKEEALPVYVKAGFRVVSDALYDPIEDKTNYYVTR